jgi:hypothetical protein
MCRSGQADTPAASHYSPPFPGIDPQPLACKEFRTIKGTIDIQRRAEAPRTAAEIAQIAGTPAMLHKRQAFDGLERAHEHAGALTVGFAR